MNIKIKIAERGNFINIEDERYFTYIYKSFYNFLKDNFKGRDIVISNKKPLFLKSQLLILSDNSADVLKYRNGKYKILICKNEVKRHFFYLPDTLYFFENKTPFINKLKNLFK